MNNSWNRFIYKCWAPVYDVFFNSGAFYKARKKIFNEIPIVEGQRVLFVGVGTGADLAFFPINQLDTTAIDYSMEMLQKAKEKYPDNRVKFLHMDAQNLQFENQSFDIIVASLILSVVPDPQKVMREMIRVSSSKGHIVIFDKFAPENKNVSLGKRIIRHIIKALGTDIGVSFQDMYRLIEHECRLIEQSDVMMNGMYKKIILKRS